MWRFTMTELFATNLVRSAEWNSSSFFSFLFEINLLNVYMHIFAYMIKVGHSVS